MQNSENEEIAGMMLPPDKSSSYQPLAPENNEKYWERLFCKFNLQPSLKYRYTAAEQGKYQLTCSTGPDMLDNINDLPFSVLLDVCMICELQVLLK